MKPDTTAITIGRMVCCRDADYRLTALLFSRSDEIGFHSYYDSSVVHIISNIVTGLLANSSRKFGYVEQAFFTKWYEESTLAVQAQVKGLVASGQLIFTNGGWSMHDEANPSWTDMLDNTHVGQRNILQNFGGNALPTATWQIDPFGFVC